MNDAFSTIGLIRQDGSLGGEKVLRRETLYRGPNGNRVERFWDARRSYIYKPVGFPKTAGRERWVARHLQPHLRGIRMPAILASSKPESPEGTAWLVYEDLGELHPPRTQADAVEAAGWAASWHRLSPDLVPAAFDGHTPDYGDVADQLEQERPALAGRLRRAGVAPAEVWAERMPALRRRIFPLEVVCHGDYHPGNIAMNGDMPIVLDWEFVHRNHPFWDLYCLLDITSFRYRKIPVTNRGRMRALKRYRDALLDRPLAGGSSPHAALLHWMRDVPLPEFAAGYAAYAALYSAWILGLIDRDLEAGRAGRRRLMRQWRETAAVLADCLALLETGERKGVIHSS